jgi:hypothetical protein
MLGLYTYLAFDIARERSREADRRRLAVLAAEGRTVRPGVLDRLFDALTAGIESIAGIPPSTTDRPVTRTLRDRPIARH